ncbi:MAG: acyl carrier protein [Ferruginibacter sp.]
MQIDIKQLEKIFQEAFGVPVVLTPSTGKDDLEAWDSINHLNLIVELEDHYKVKFNIKEIESLNSVSDILSLLNQKLNNTNF